MSYHCEQSWQEWPQDVRKKHGWYPGGAHKSSTDIGELEEIHATSWSRYLIYSPRI